MSEIPSALKKAGIKQVSSNRGGDQRVQIKDGMIGLFFGEELAQRLIARQQQRKQHHG
ncbi:hypothetical protein [uncultured Alteromonas sp.]|uniref:hypothetical protein n=1 Tax=uncultured Alteromonas sp. TaxID=179113 RepID=UPI0025CE3824|nr:hypothetical protein [uncultured Alteromonas sp.]